MRYDRELATKLRKSGKSYRQISAELRISSGTLSEWFGGAEWSKKITGELNIIARKKHKIRIEQLNRVRGKNLKNLYEQARKEAREDFEELKYHPLFITGVMLYWAKAIRHPCIKLRLQTPTLK